MQTYMTLPSQILMTLLTTSLKKKLFVGTEEFVPSKRKQSNFLICHGSLQKIENY